MSTTKAYRHLLTQSVINFRSLVETQNVYVYFGKSTPWDNENEPNEVSGCDQCEKNTRANFIYLKKLSVADTALAATKYQWAYGTKYDQYSVDDPDLWKKKFFIVTDTGQVYKCLSNNNGANSTIAPTGTPTNPFITADGYQWKFMYNISVPVAEKFTATNFLVVPTGTQKTSNQELVELTAVETSTSPNGGHGKNAVLELFAHAFIATKSLNLADVKFDGFEHRQVGILVNPLLENGTPATADEYFLASSTIDRKSGILVNKTNHIVISSEDDTAETVQLVLEF